MKTLKEQLIDSIKDNKEYDFMADYGYLFSTIELITIVQEYMYLVNNNVHMENREKLIEELEDRL